MATVEFSFLTSGPSFRFDVPTGLPSVPYLASPIVSGIGGREFGFTPAPNDRRLSEGMAAEGELLRKLTSRDGRLVDLYRRLEPPLTWWLRWQLGGGILASHLRDVDGIDRADVVAGNLEVVDDGATPFLLLYPPLRPIVSTFPGYQEFAWVQSRQTGQSITLMRPGFLDSGATVTKELDVGVQLRAGTAFGLEVQVYSGQGLSDALSVLSGTLDSLTDR